LDSLYLKWFFEQICGLSDAIRRLHHPGTGNASASAVRAENSSSLRHGDLKPENILLFENRKEAQERRKKHWILQITDVGLAKSHEQATELRDATRAYAGTIMYEPPEATEGGTARSRRYDVWSMGCIYLEFLIWILYGAEGLVQFGQDIRGQGSKATFYDVDDKSSLNAAVEKWIDHIAKVDQRCSKDSALRRLLEVIVDGLLVPYLGKRNKKGGSPVLSRMSTLQDGETIPQGRDMDLPTFNVRPPTALGAPDGLPNRTPERWYASTMSSKIRQIYDDATREQNPIAWMDFSAPTQEGPEKLLAPHNSSSMHQNRQVRT
jgi:serine/threonine protein kinase